MPRLAVGHDCASVHAVLRRSLRPGTGVAQAGLPCGLTNVIVMSHWKERAFLRQFRRSVPTDPHGESLLCRRVYNRYAILVGLAMRRAELSKSKICTLQCCAVADRSSLQLKLQT